VKKPFISFVVLNWKTKQETKQCIETILQQDLTDLNYEIVVIENGSNDGSYGYLKNAFSSEKSVRAYANKNNLGFAGGQTSSLKYINKRTDFVALVNSDAALNKDWAKLAVEALMNDPEIAAVGGRAFHWNNNSPVFDTSSAFYSYQIIDPENGYAKTVDYGSQKRFVDGLSGAALMLNFKYAVKVGYFDSSFFLYYEETDLLARLKRAGYRVLYEPKLKVWHKIGASSGGTDTKASYVMRYYMSRNRLFFAVKNFDNHQLKIFLVRFLIVNLKYFTGRLKLSRPELRLNLRVFIACLLYLPRLIIVRRKVLKLGSTYSSLLEGMSRPQDVTVVIPCYNYGKYVSEAIESALTQSHTPYKIIVINDGSTDSSKKVIDKYKDNPIIEIIHKQNEGIITTKNLGVKLSETYWTIFLDADDKLDSTYIEKLLHSARETRADVVYTDMRLFGATSSVVRFPQYNRLGIWGGNYVHNSALIRTDLLKEVGGYKYEMANGYEDWELYISLSELTDRFTHVAEPLLWYRQHGQGGRNHQADLEDSKLRDLIHSLHPNYMNFHANAYKINSKAILLPLRLTKKLIRKPWLIVFQPLILLLAVIFAVLKIIMTVVRYCAIYFFKINRISLR